MAALALCVKKYVQRLANFVPLPASAPFTSFFYARKMPGKRLPPALAILFYSSRRLKIRHRIL
jgi:hypothetical protein